MYSSILVPVDLDHIDNLTTALETAGKVAQEYGALVTYLLVAEVSNKRSAIADGKTLRDRFEDFTDLQAAIYGISTTNHIMVREKPRLNVGQEVIETAKDLDCDLIVMASHKPGFKEHIIASNAGYVASHAPLTVYVVR